MSDIPHSTNDYDDDGSLFGSPPPSPSRGRSPSPLAFPSGTAQNVGTLALPGTHLVAELPVTPPASSSLSASATAPSHQPVSRPPPQLRLPLQSIRGPSRRNTACPTPPSRAESTTRKSRKGKGREKSSTPRPTPPPIPLPSPDETPPPNFLRNQQALLGVAGMVGGINPANLAKTRQTRGATAENPIVVEEEPTLHQQPPIGKHPTRPGPSDPSQLPRPTSEQILGTLLQQKNIFPVVVSLLRLLVPSAPSLSLVPPNDPSYPYPCVPALAAQTPDVYPSPSPFLPSFAQTRSQTPEQISGSSRQSPGFHAPPLKRRKLNSVPAGAGDWDVPYPFQQGHGPENYRANWERERGKQLLADLVQLVRGAAQKAATKAWYQQQARQRVHLQGYGRGVPGAWYGQPGTMKYYRPATFFYGLERPNGQHHALQVHPQVCVTSGTSSAASSSTPPPEAAPPSFSPEWAQQPTQPEVQPNTVSAPDFSSAAFDQLVESLLAAQQQQQSSSDNAVSSTWDLGMDLDTSVLSEQCTQAFFDNWLEMLASFPPGDPNDASGSGAVGSVAPATSTATSPSLPMLDGSPPSQVPDAMIDPALLDLAASSLMGTASHPEVSSSAGSGPHPPLVVNATGSSSTATSLPSTTANRQPPAHTPSLVGSPSVSATSLAEDAGPATPSWDWAFADLGDMEGAKLLDESAGMDVDVVMAEWGGGNTPAASVPGRVLPTTTAISSALAPPLQGHGAEPGGEQGAPSHGALLERAANGVDTTLSSGPASGLTPTSIPSAFSCTPPQQPASYLSPPAQVIEALSGLGAVPANPSAHAKGKAKAIPGLGAGVGAGLIGKQDRRAVLEKARGMRAALVAEIERAKVALWETTLEQGALVGLGRELENLEKEKETNGGEASSCG